MAGRNENKQHILDAWAKAQAEGMPMSRFVESVKDHPTLKVSLQGLRNWTKGEGSASNTSSTTHRATSKTGANLLAEFEAQERDARDKRLLNFLQDAVKDLEAQLAAAQSELRRHKESMGLIQPSVEE